MDPQSRRLSPSLGRVAIGRGAQLLSQLLLQQPQLPPSSSSTLTTSVTARLVADCGSMASGGPTSTMMMTISKVTQCMCFVAAAAANAAALQVCRVPHS